MGVFGKHEIMIMGEARLNLPYSYECGVKERGKN